MLRIFDSTGSLVHEVNLTSAQQTISLGGLPAGMYLAMPVSSGAAKIFAARSLMISK
jgi:hypothetical protein